MLSGARWGCRPMACTQGSRSGEPARSQALRCASIALSAACRCVPSAAGPPTGACVGGPTGHGHAAGAVRAVPGAQADDRSPRRRSVGRPAAAAGLRPRAGRAAAARTWMPKACCASACRSDRRQGRLRSGLAHSCPGATAVLLDGTGLRVDPEQVQPAVAHQLAHDLVAGHHRVDGRARCLDEDVQAQRRVPQRAAGQGSCPASPAGSCRQPCTRARRTP